MSAQAPDAPAPDGEARREVALRPGYHSPQVEVDVRLNTNESPEPPPGAFLDALSAEVSTIGFHRYPDREATALRSALAAHHGVEAAQVFCANGSNEVIQCLLLAYGGQGRPAMIFEPTYALHSHIARLTATPVVEGRRDDAFKVDLEEVARTTAVAAERYGPSSPGCHLPVLAQQPDRRRRADRDSSGSPRPRPGAGRGRRGLWPVRSLVGARADRR